MPQPLLWERLQVFLSAFDLSHNPVPAPRPTPPTPIPTHNSRVSALEHALLIANTALSDERARRAKWERRAIVARAEQTAQMDDLIHNEKRLKHLEKKLSKADTRLDDERRARRVAEEQRDVALRRLTEGPDDTVMGQLERENEALRERLDRLSTNFYNDKEHLEKENVTLKTEMMQFRADVQRERESFVTELAQRTTNFANLEKELRDARQTYVTAAKIFETHRQRNGNLDASEKRLSMPTTFGKMEADAVHQIKLEHLMRECQRLADENENLKKVSVLSTGESSSDDKTCSHGEVTSSSQALHEGKSPRGDAALMGLRAALSEAQAERNALRKQVAAFKMENDGADRLSSSSMSSESGDPSKVCSKVRELEATLEDESREAEELRKQVVGLEETAARNGQEASHLRGEMVAIHSKMRRMASLSLPKGAEELLGDDEDVKRLARLRELAKGKEGKDRLGTLQKKVHAKRRGRLSENKKVIRPWLHK